MPETRTDDPTPQSGWHTPEDESIVAPAVESALPGWKVPTLDVQFGDIPEEAGGWHRPRSVDTTLSPTDETVVIMPVEEAKETIPEATPVAPEEMPSVLSPEDALQTLGDEDGDTAIEDAVRPTEPLSPEDALSMLDLVDEEEEEAGVRSELMALNMLAGDTAADLAAAAEDLPLPGEEAALMPADEGDPAEVARRRLAELDAAESAAPAELVAPALSDAEMRQQELARRFTQTQEDIEQLRMLYRQGSITAEQFEAELQNRMILDDDQVWWRMGADDAAWYKYVGDQWVPDTPPLFEPARAGLMTERLDPNDPLNAPLSYIGDSAQVEVSGPASTLPGVGYTPLPRQVPTEDLDGTMVGMAAFRESLDGPTIAGETVRIGDRTGTGIEALDYGISPGIEAAIDESEPPVIDYTMPIGELALEAEARARTTTARTGVLVLVGVIALALIAVAGGLIIANNWYSSIVTRFEPQIAALAAYQPEFQTVVIQDWRRQEIARLADGGDRVAVDLNEISPLLIHAVISTRNPTFYDDPGWDTGTTINAWLGNIEVPVQPTITQLVAQNLVLQGGGGAEDVDLVVVSGEMGRRYSKDFILSLFLNEFPFGNGTYGAEAAARFYFDKSAAELNLPEAALLAAIMENPGGIDPVTNRAIVKPAIENVFERMAFVGCLNLPGVGQRCIGPQDFNTVQTIRQKADVELRQYQPREVTTQYPHFVNLVRQQLEAVYGQELYARGFIVQTTLVPSAQDAAEELLRTRLQELSGTGITTGAVMWTDPTNGAVRAYIGSPDYDDPNIDGQRDYTRDYRPPGTAILPVLYAAALEGVDRNGNGQVEFNEYFTAASLLWDVPSQFPGTPSQPPFAPQNFDGRFYGPVTLREAAQSQYASAAVRVYNEIGEVALRQMAERMGVQFNSDALLGPQTALGETPVRMRDLMTAYGTIASGGVRRTVYVIESITDRSGAPVNVPEVIKPPEQRAFSPQVAFVLQNILSDDLSRNQAIFPRNSALTLPNLQNTNMVAAVPGTNPSRTNMWTFGFTTNAVVGVWLGTPEGSVSISNQTGFSTAAPLWNRVISLVLAGLGANNAPRAFGDPGGTAVLNICPVTGTVFQQNLCPVQARQEIFAQARQPLPVELGPVITVPINTWTGLRANQFCNIPEDMVQRVYLNSDDPFVVEYLNSAAGRQFAQRLGLGTTIEAAPNAQCDANTQTQLPTVNITGPANGASVQGEIQVMGQVSAPANFNRWQLEIAPQGTTNFQLLPGFPQQAQQSTPNSVLTTLDTTTIPNGNYTLRIVAISNDGGSVNRSVNFNINNPIPTPTPVPTVEPTPFPTFDFGVSTPIPFDAIPTFDAGPTFDIGPTVGPSPTPDPF